MKSFLAIIIALNISHLSARTAPELLASYNKKRAEFASDKDTAIETLTKNYLSRLEQVKKETQKSSKLEIVEIIVAEIKLVSLRTWPLNPLSEKAPRALKKGRSLFEKIRLDIDKKHASSLVRTTDTMLDLLEKRKISATREGALTDARAARSLIIELQNDSVISRARTVNKMKNFGAQAPIALRLRRYGDDIEAIVRYDASGNISFKCPIENTIEETGGKHEKGDTFAKTLGEFIGATGYTPAPYTACNYTFSGVELPKLISSQDVGLKSGELIDGVKGLEIKLNEGAKNPFFAVLKVFPPVEYPGKFRVTTTYLIPKDNKSLNGFSLFQGGALLQNHVFGTQGKWITTQLEESSKNSETLMRLYYKFKQGKGFKDAANEKIYIQNITVEQHCFSAFVQARYNGRGELVQSFPKAAAQKLLIKNGKFVSN